MRLQANLISTLTYSSNITGLTEGGGISPPGSPIAQWDMQNTSTLWTDIAKTTNVSLGGDTSTAVIEDTVGSYDWTQATASARGTASATGVETDGVDDYYVADSLAAAFNGGYTIGFNVTYLGSNQCMFSCHTSTSGNAGLLFLASGMLKWFKNSGSSTGSTTMVSGTSYRVVLVVRADGSTDIYLNGVSEITLAAGQSPLPPTDGKVSLAQEWDSSSPSNFINMRYRRMVAYNSDMSGSLADIDTWLNDV